MSYIVGLTGGIGSGKSAVAQAFGALGADVADADHAAHAVTARDAPGLAAVVEAFGEEMLDASGALDRARLRQLVFDDSAARSRLEALLHPMIRDQLRQEVAAWQGPYGLLVVPLLLERGALLPLVSRVLVVDCSEEEQVRRVGRRSGIPSAQVRAIMATQMPREERLARADDVLDNSGPVDAIGPRVAELDALYRKFALQSARSPHQDA